MPLMATADALRLAINLLRVAAESRRLPSGIELDDPTAGLHADAADTLATSLADLEDHE